MGDGLTDFFAVTWVNNEPSRLDRGGGRDSFKYVHFVLKKLSYENKTIGPGIYFIVEINPDFMTLSI